MYFKNVSNITELKKQYRKLASIYHPDNIITGNLDTMQKINTEYEALFNQLKAGDKTVNKQETASDFINIINELIKYDDLTIDIIGCWIWLDGKTYDIKNQLKLLGFMWSSSRKKWYFNGSTKKERIHYKQKDYSILKIAYGCKTIKTEKTVNMVLE